MTESMLNALITTASATERSRCASPSANRQTTLAVLPLKQRSTARTTTNHHQDPGQT
ncbi:hypothetical protein F610DRAFT_02931 [Streptomyces sp. LaPpAH-199]|uniref:Uncharacterized protein n=1 Tax=Streptomyces globisporus TaxID=1908 RepID=A0A927BJH2_STRGL|nr:hypothetical protein [Streptomyces globisporus]SDC87845.1 hypothetical protein F610DRAFT_02931 [Streptomyces sp. LaPpAH-199]